MQWTDRTRGTIEMSAAMLISSTIGLLVLVSGQPVLSVVFWRCLVGAITLLAICGSLRFFQRRYFSRRMLLLSVLGGVALVGNWLLLFASYSKASIGIATMVYNTQPFMLVALGAVFFREKLTLGKMAWLAMAFAGMALIVEPGEINGTGEGQYLAGIGLALGAAFLYAIASIIAKRLKGVPPHLVALIQVCAGTIPWASLLTLGVVHTGVMYVLLYGGIQKLPTHLTASLSFIYPVVALIVDAVAFERQFAMLQLLGSAIILLAAAGMNLGWALPGTRRTATP
jgi:drug/metabolite transporter (DMT)-like permease